MKILNLVATTTAQQRVKEYLEANASDVLADKINNGVLIERDGKTLINKKTLDGFMSYATEEARKIAEQGARSACIEDSVVFGWAIHYFEEESIEGTLYNEDGTEYAKPKPAPKKKEKPKKTEKVAPPSPVPQKTKNTPPEPPAEKTSEPQLSLFDFMI